MRNVPLISKRSSKESKVKDKVGEESDGGYQRITVLSEEDYTGKIDKMLLEHHMQKSTQNELRS